MDSRLSIRGNDLEPVLVMFPLGLLTVAVLLDLSRVLGAPPLIGTLAFCTVAAGLVGGTMTALAVRIDEIAGHHARTRPVTLRRLLDGAVLVVFAVTLMLRMRTPERTAGPGVLVIELMGLGVAGVGVLIGAVSPKTGRPRTSPRTVRLAQILSDSAEEP